MVDKPESRKLVRVMIFISFLCFVVSVWLGHYQTRYFFDGIFWLILVIVLSALLGSKSR